MIDAKSLRLNDNELLDSQTLPESCMKPANMGL